MKILSSSKGGINMNPKITIIIPVYNAQNYLNRLIISLNEQTYQNFEVIFVNDGSTDNSKKMLDIAAQENSNFIVIHQENSGAPVARNRGIKVARGDYIYFCDADDELELDTLAMFYEKASQTNAELILGYYKKIKVDTTSFKDITFDPQIVKNKKSCMFLSPFPGNKLIKKSVIDKNHLLFENVKIGQDLLFYQMLLPHVKKIDCVNKVVYKYYVNEGSISNSYDEKILGIIETFNLMDNYYKQNKEYDFYKDELQYLRNNHLLTQILKVPFIKEINLRKKIFDELVTNLNLDELNQNKYYTFFKRAAFILIPYSKLFLTHQIFRPLAINFLCWYNGRGFEKI